MATNTEKIVVQVVVKGQKDLQNLEGTTKKASGSVGGLVKQYGFLTLGIATAVQAFRNINKLVGQSIRTFRDYEFQMAKVRATTGASNKDFAKLSKTAEDLGRSTFFTAQQVAELQTNFGKLGFSTKEILNAQDATLQLATATDTDLGRAAIVAGAAVRGFGLDAAETQRVVDVMAVAFTSSALDIEKFQTSMTKVAPIAKSAGFSIEDTTAIMAQLTDAGIEASIAGTSLRNILLKMQDPNSDLVKSFGKTIHSLDDLVPALKKFSDEGGDLAKIMEVVDLRQAAAFEQMITSKERTVELRNELRLASGAAQAMAEIVGDTLEGAFKRLNSAMQGLMINLSESFIGRSLQNVVDRFAGLVNVVSDFIDIPVSETLEKQRVELNILVGRLTDVNIQEKERNKLLGEIQVKYPDFLKNLDTEKVTTTQLRDRLRELNVTLKNRILLQREVEKAQKAKEKADKAVNKEIDKEEKFLGRLNQITEKYNITLQEGLTFQQQYDTVIKQLELEFNGLGRALDPARNQAVKLTNNFIGLTNAQRSATKSTKEYADAEKDVVDLEKELGLLVETNTTSLDENTNATNKNKESKLATAEATKLTITAEEEILNHKFNLLQQGLLSEVEAEKVREQLHRDEMKRIKESLNKYDLSIEQREDLIKRFTEIEKKLIKDNQEDKEKAFQDDVKRAILSGQTAEEAMKSVVRAQIMEAVAGFIASIFKNVPFPLNLILAAGASAAVGGLIDKQLSRFENGGMIQEFANGGMVHGNSHAQGGEKFAVGGRVVELEGGEAVINKRSTSMFRNQLSAMNAAGGGVKFADGGLMNMPSFAQSQFSATSQAGMMGAIGQGGKVVVVESDISTVQNTVSVIEAEATI
jgi:TP901 family phage tail tape measure protein